jgi:hypothetical protein
LWLLAIPLAIAVTLAGLLFEAAAAKLAPAGVDTTSGPRLALVVHLSCIGGAFAFGSSDREIAAVALFTWLSAVVALFGAFAATVDQDGAARPADRHPLFGLFGPAGFHGLRFTLAVEVLLAVATWFALDTGSTSASNERALRFVVATPGWIASWLALAIIVGRGVMPGLMGSAARLRWLSLGLPIAALVIGGMAWSDLSYGDDTGWIAFLNPLVVSSGPGDGGGGAWFLLPIGAGLALLADRVLVHDWVEATERRERARRGAAR